MIVYALRCEKKCLMQQNSPVCLLYILIQSIELTKLQLYLSVMVAKCWFLGFVVCLDRNPDLDVRIFDCLPASMSAVQAEDVRASFLFVGDLNGHHHQWLGSTTTNHHGVEAFDFATVFGCDQLVVGPTHARGGTLSLDLLMTDVSDLVGVAVVAPIGNSDHSSLSAVISMAQAVPNLCVSGKVLMKHQVNWNTVCGAIWELP